MDGGPRKQAIAALGRMERLRARLFPEDSPPADQERDFLAEQCTTLGREHDSLRAKLERAKDLIYRYIDPASVKPEHEAILSELSADAPAPQQISDDMREAMAEAEKALEPFAGLRVARFMTDGYRYDYRLDVAWIRRASAALAKLRSIRNDT